MPLRSIMHWLLRLLPALILLQTLFFKFSASEESVYIFSAVGMEPWGRILTGSAELLASIMLLIPRTTVVGAIMGLGIMAGAILSHLFILGIEVKNDGGLLFGYACLVFLCCLLLLIIDRRRFAVSLKQFFPSASH